MTEENSMRLLSLILLFYCSFLFAGQTVNVSETGDVIRGTAKDLTSYPATSQLQSFQPINYCELVSNPTIYGYPITSDTGSVYKCINASTSWSDMPLLGTNTTSSLCTIPDSTLHWQDSSGVKSGPALYGNGSNTYLPGPVTCNSDDHFSTAKATTADGQSATCTEQSYGTYRCSFSDMYVDVGDADYQGGIAIGPASNGKPVVVPFAYSNDPDMDVTVHISKSSDAVKSHFPVTVNIGDSVVPVFVSYIVDWTGNVATPACSLTAPSELEYTSSESSGTISNVMTLTVSCNGSLLPDDGGDKSPEESVARVTIAPNDNIYNYVAGAASGGLRQWPLNNNGSGTSYVVFTKDGADISAMSSTSIPDAGVISTCSNSTSCHTSLSVHADVSWDSPTPGTHNREFLAILYYQ
ncbi:hypothetical protein [Citrobacter werkmanii]|uniref:hypothetical protein n=1 Tax=Citrobacter werkmanii TaxID=67827 RepID=UPI00264ED713|nr:hypothetical protein [Citrobacter werkmanii]MDN8559086.1 hypothetical protein [Citrobacter werkmanii]